MYNDYAKKRLAENKQVPYKKWFDLLIDKRNHQITKRETLDADFGCIEMEQIEGTLENFINQGGKINLSIIFEYLYTKLVAAFIGRVIFTDDHLGNVAYITVDYYRHYKIKCNGCDYHFYIPPGKMVQMIDLERYVFNYSQYDVYTNRALQSINDLANKSYHLDRVKKSYLGNTYIFDKTIHDILDTTMINSNNFVSEKSYDITTKIFNTSFSYDIKTFCQVMETNLPQEFLDPPNNPTINTRDFYLDLDDDNLRVISLDMLNKKLT
jgi:hypothetical protein